MPSSFDCFLVIRSVKTLHVRMKEHMANALAIAKFLESHPKVDKVTKYISLDKVTCLGSISNARITSPT